jgi:hypothetical protein
VALQHCGWDLSYAIGGDLTGPARTRTTGGGELFVAEADESDGAFLVYSPFGAVVTNVEADHLDNYGRRAAYDAAFDRFVERIDPDGFLVTCVDDPGAARLRGLARSLALAAIGFGTVQDADLRAESIRFAGTTSRFTVVGDGRRLGEVSLRIPGRHYVLDAVGALAAGLGWASPSPSCGTVSNSSAEPVAGWSSKARPAACGSMTATPTTPRDQGRPAGGQVDRGATGEWSRASSPTWSAGPGSSPPRWEKRWGWPTRWW